jgi:hypothetical protein
MRTSTPDGPPGQHGTDHWRAGCRETGPSRSGRGRRNSTPTRSTSLAAYFTLRAPRRSNVLGLPDENWFSIITRQAIRRGTFNSVKILIGQIEDYIQHWNTHTRPFAWTATADQILATVRLVQTNIKKLVDNNAK